MKEREVTVTKTTKKPRLIAVVGLGYVGLPVAAAFAKKQTVIGYDKSTQRIEALQRGHDATREVDASTLQSLDLHLTHNPTDLAEANFYIVAVPTPINESNQPDLRMLLEASYTVGQHLKPGDIVVYESTVYPGATEDDCVPVLENASQLICGKDFTVGYSPERINPGDKTHRFETIMKVVAGQNEETLEVVAETYASVVEAGVYRAPSIRTAEAAKVIENTQRDLNIALMNELAIIFDRMGIDTQEVLKAAGTKWNFLPFKPGLVGGHCIGVDPYYLTYQAQRYGYQPEVILAGRRINDQVASFIAERTIKAMIHAGYRVKGSRVAVLGLTFKEDCPDLRNSKVIDIIRELEDYGVECLVHDPLANAAEAKACYGISLKSWDDIERIDAFVLAVAHQEYQSLELEDYQEKCRDRFIAVDVKSMLNFDLSQHPETELWRL